MIEPTETECKDDIDQFIAALKTIVREAAEQPELLRQAATDQGAAARRGAGGPLSLSDRPFRGLSAF